MSLTSHQETHPFPNACKSFLIQGEVSKIALLFKVGIPFISALGAMLILLLVINDAEAEGLLKPNTNSMIFEGTVGSTGISIATVVGVSPFMVEVRVV